MNNPTAKSYHELIRTESFTNLRHYNKFLNWVSGEFDLYLQDEQNDLQVFFPNGMFCIKKTTNTKNSFIAEITVKSKVLSQGKDIINQILFVYKQIEKLFSYSFLKQADFI